MDAPIRRNQRRHQILGGGEPGDPARHTHYTTRLNGIQQNLRPARRGGNPGELEKGIDMQACGGLHAVNSIASPLSGDGRDAFNRLHDQRENSTDTPRRCVGVGALPPLTDPPACAVDRDRSGAGFSTSILLGSPRGVGAASRGFTTRRFAPPRIAARRIASLRNATTFPGTNRPTLRAATHRNAPQRNATQRLFRERTDPRCATPRNAAHRLAPQRIVFDCKAHLEERN
jgi:hypothetical protein